MENQRLILWLIFGFLVYLTWQQWQQDYNAPPPRPAAEPGPTPTAPAPSPDDELPALGEVPGELPGGAPGVAAAPAEGDLGELVRVETDVLELAIDLRGGSLVKAVLKDYPRRKDEPGRLVQLLDPDPFNYYVFRGGLRAAGGAPEPNHKQLWSADSTDFVLGDDQDTLEVALAWSHPSGLAARKVYTFTRGGYAVDVRNEVTNGTGEPWRGASYVQLARRFVPIDRSMVDVDTYSARGPVIYDGEKYDKLDIKDLAKKPLEVTTTGGWLGAIQHHFVAAAVPPADEPATLRATYNRGIYTTSAIGTLHEVAPGSTHTFQKTLFVGPKLQEQLRETADGLELTVDYGWLTFLAQPLFWLLEKIHSVVGNWGWAIVFLTVLIKLALYKLSETSGKSLAKMRKLQPRMKALQERYKDDRQALSEAMMKLYREEKTNPAAGCLPILVQMPVFLALYWVLLESVEIRQAPFMLWIDDLSSKDPYFILPILMGITMIAQQKLNPAPPDPVQAKIMMALPFIFTIFFAFFPAGLVLYWFVNNLLAIAQQWHINRVVERSG